MVQILLRFCRGKKNQHFTGDLEQPKKNARRGGRDLFFYFSILEIFQKIDPPPHPEKKITMDPWRGTDVGVDPFFTIYQRTIEFYLRFCKIAPEFFLFLKKILILLPSGPLDHCSIEELTTDKKGRILAPGFVLQWDPRPPPVFQA